MLILLLLIVPVVIAAGGLAVWLLHRSAAAGAGLMVSAMVANAIAIEPIEVRLLGFHVYAGDLVALALAAVAALHFCQFSGAVRRAKVWLGFLAAVLLAFVLGAASNGLKAAGVEFRQFFHFLAAIAYVAAFPLTAHALKGLAGVWLAGCGALVAVALFRWASVLAGLSIAGTWAAVGAGKPMRVLNASHALFLAQGAIMLIYFARLEGGRYSLKLLLGLAAVSVVLLQHRSVWAALTVSIAALCYRERLFGRFLALVAIAAGIAGAAILADPREWAFENVIARSLIESVEEPLDLDQSSFGWRLLMWHGYVMEFLQLPAGGMITGLGFGNPGSYSVGGTESAASAHNLYIFLLNRTGLLGLATLMVSLRSLWGRVRIPFSIRPVAGWSPPNLLFAILAGQVVYFTVYGPSPEQGLLAGTMTAGPRMWRRFETAAAGQERGQEAGAAIAGGVR